MSAYILVFPKLGVTTAKAKDGWSWHRMNKGKITAGNSGFDSRGNAMAAAKGDVKAVCKSVSDTLPVFRQKAHKLDALSLIITWGRA